jgi:hypothetical protein
MCRFKCSFRLVVGVTVMMYFNLGTGALGEETPEIKAALASWGEAYEKQVLPIIKDRCLACHSSEDPDGGLDLTLIATGTAAIEKMDRWEQIAKRVRLKEMPPRGSQGLTNQQTGIFHRWVESRPAQNNCDKIASDESQSWYRGFVMCRRLTRAEYFNAISDVTGVAIDPMWIVPSDGAGGEGFDTNGATLFTSPLHIEQYLAVAIQAITQGFHQSTIQIPSDASTTSDGARGMLAQFTRRAWRRPVEPNEVTQLLKLYELAGSRGASFVDAITEPLAASLVSPHFLFVVESESEAGGVQRLTPHQLALRLSLLVWSSIPDEHLLSAADRNELNTDEQVIAQLHRMLQDPKARRLGENFGLQWLGLTHFAESAKPDPELFPEFNSSLAADMREEAVQCVSRVFAENLSIDEWIESNVVTVNGRLAAHYGIELPATAPWQPVVSSDGLRGGVLTLGAVLVQTSYPRRTSPVLRGRWLLEEILGSRVPPPPPNVPSLDATVSEKPQTLRQQLEEHRNKPDCASCHERMDPLGFGLENFDPLARWRTQDQGIDIDAEGTLPSGETYRGPAELKQTLMSRRNEFQRHLVRKFLGYALGRELNRFDDCVIDNCCKQLAENDHRAWVMLESIVTSYPFQHRFFKAGS